MWHPTCPCVCSGMRKRITSLSRARLAPALQSIGADWPKVLLRPLGEGSAGAAVGKELYGVEPQDLECVTGEQDNRDR